MEFNRQQSPTKGVHKDRSAVPVQQSVAGEQAGPAGRRMRPGRRMWMLVAGIIVFIMLAVAGKIILFSSIAGQGIIADRYQAVFLTNGQFYFGKLTITQASYVLKQPYFIKNPDAKTTDQEQATTQLQTAQFELQRVRNVVYGPDDEMRINKDQVLFWQNLSSGSKVVSAIKDDKDKKE